MSSTARTLRPFMLCLLPCLLLAGTVACGYKGPLYLPENVPETPPEAARQEAEDDAEERERQRDRS